MNVYIYELQFTYFYRFFYTLQNSVWDLHGPLNFNISFEINIITSGFIAFCFAWCIKAQLLWCEIF